MLAQRSLKSFTSGWFSELWKTPFKQHGRQVTRADRPTVNAVFESIAEEDFSLRAAIHGIVAHPAFGQK